MNGRWIVKGMAGRARRECAPAAFGVVGIRPHRAAILEDSHDIGVAIAELRQRVSNRIGHVAVNEPRFAAFADFLRGATPAQDELAFGCHSGGDARDHGAAYPRIIGQRGVPRQTAATHQEDKKYRRTPHGGYGYPNMVAKTLPRGARAFHMANGRHTGRLMILGIGTDLCNIDRIAGVLERHGDRFRNRVFTDIEQAKAERRADTPGTYAKRWAAKEACSKALGTGLRMGIAWKDMSVTNLRTGQPVMQVTGWAATRLEAMTPKGFEAVIHVTLTDDHPWAQAFVLIEARPIGQPGELPVPTTTRRLA